ncbi:hypothetical protein N0V90_008066 [Kalmusia sp. IMI 367209]|nr:hypothetical protein N0V90_008066 [Kalmusia sp. IMI 367209]
MSFGFSVGDFLAVLKLVGTVIDGLRESSHVSTSVRSLINELNSLETALLRVKRLDLGADQNAERVALRQAASRCQQTIDAFYKKLQKDQPYLQQQSGLDFNMKAAWAKIKWAVGKGDDLETFRAKIRGPTNSIERLLLTTQMEATIVQGRTRDLQHERVAHTIRNFSRQAMEALSSIFVSVTQSVQ